MVVAVVTGTAAQEFRWEVKALMLIHVFKTNPNDSRRFVASEI